MSEVTEFLVWRSALAETPSRLRQVIGTRRGPEATIVERMAARDAEATARLAGLLGVETDVPESATVADQVSGFAAGRTRLLALLALVDGSSLHREVRLADRRVLDPWRLAGDLAEHDVQSLAEIRRLGQQR